MAVDEKLLEFVVCPNCRGPVEYLKDHDVIMCTGDCRYRYPVRDDIPVLLVDEAEKP